MMRRVRLLAIPVAVVALLGIGVATRPDAAPPTSHPTYYVALGDSYASGVGAGGSSSGGDCDRSNNAYPALWAAANRPTGFTFAACSGAQTSDVSAEQLSALGPQTTLVSVTIGGNDIGFVDVMRACTIEGPLRCDSEIDTAQNKVRTELPGRLDTLYLQIAARAPNAKVVVLTYPRFYDVGAAPCPGVLDPERARINAGTDLLDDTIIAAAHRHGFTVGDVRAPFAAGHEICDAHPWMNAVVLFAISTSYHPNADGQRDGYLPVFSAEAR